MQRFTISISDELAHQFDHFIEAKGYVNRSEAVRDLIRDKLGDATTDLASQPDGGWCVANVSFVYDHHEQTTTIRLLDLQHDMHDLVVSSLHTHLDHDNCMETVVLRGPLEQVLAFSEQLVALRGVRHGNIHLIPLGPRGKAHHHHGKRAKPGQEPHVHLTPLN